MKKLYSILFLLLFSATSYAAHSIGNIVQYERINGRKYKVVYLMNEDRLIIHYFDQGGISQGKYELVGVEIFKGGEIVEDTFKENDR